MKNSTGVSRMAGRIGSLLGLLGLFSFLFGIFGGPRAFAFAGVALMVAAFTAFFIEETSLRRAERRL